MSWSSWLRLTFTRERLILEWGAPKIFWMTQQPCLSVAILAQLQRTVVWMFSLCSSKVRWSRHIWITWLPWRFRERSRTLLYLGSPPSYDDFYRLSEMIFDLYSERGTICLNKFCKALVPCLLFATYTKLVLIYVLGQNEKYDFSYLPLGRCYQSADLRLAC